MPNKKTWGLPIPPPPTYRPCNTCGGPMVVYKVRSRATVSRCEFCHPKTQAEKRLDEAAERYAEALAAAEMEAV